MTDSTINANIAECIKSNDHFGYSVVTNICNGQTHTLSWGFFDWVGTLLLMGLGLGVVLMVFALAVVLYTLVKESFQ